MAQHPNGLIDGKNLAIPANFKVEAPVRIDFCGGYTDLAEISQVTGTAIVNLAIDLYTDPQRTQKVPFEITLRPPHHPTPDLEAPEVALFQALHQHFEAAASPSTPVLDYSQLLNLNLKIPVSTGLGTSSTLCVMLMAAARLCQGWDVEQIRQQGFLDAQQFEKLTLQVKGGYQDFLSALYGGYSLITARAEDEDLQAIKDPQKIQVLNCPVQNPQVLAYLHTHVWIVYSPRTAPSSAILEDLVARSERGSKILELSHQICDQNRNFHDRVFPLLSHPGELSESTRPGLPSPLTLDPLIDCVRTSWHLRQALSDLTDNPVLSEIEQALQSDIYCTHGVGAGGSVLVLYGKPDRADQIHGKLAQFVQDLPVQVFYPKVNHQGLGIHREG